AAPQADGEPFVVLSATSGEVRRFDSLAAAVRSAHDGDTIEIRGNGPFITEPIFPGNLSLVIRAGTGFRPVILLGTHDLPILDTRGKRVLEGLEFQRFDRGNVLVKCLDAPVFAVNCRFIASGVPWSACIAAYAPRWSVRNCEFICPGSIAIGT